METFLREYTIHKKIDEGSFGVVYKATHKTKKMTVAIKRVKSNNPLSYK